MTLKYFEEVTAKLTSLGLIIKGLATISAWQSLTVFSVYATSPRMSAVELVAMQQTISTHIHFTQPINVLFLWNVVEARGA